MVEFGSADAVTEVDIPSLLRHLEQVPDPRDRRGCRHPMAYALALAACAVPAGTRSLTAITEWAADLPHDRLARTGARTLDSESDHACRPPSEATFRRVLQRLDGDTLHDAISSYLREHAQQRSRKNQPEEKRAGPSGRGRQNAGLHAAPRRQPGPSPLRPASGRDPGPAAGQPRISSVSSIDVDVSI